MIFELIARWILSFNWLDTMKPVELPAGIESGVRSIFNFLGFISPVCDLSYLFTTIGMVFTLFVLGVVVKFILGFFHK